MSDGWFFNSELLIKTEKLKKKIVEIPVNWKDDGDSRVKIFRTVKEYLLEIERVKKQLKTLA